MCTARCRWAPACFFISAWLLAPAVCLGGGEKAPVATAALELGLAQQGDLYLVLDPQRRVLEVKARGVVLDAVAITGFVLLAHRPARPVSPPVPVDLPAVFVVEDDAEASHRRLLAPAALVPYSEEPEAAAPPTGVALEEAPIPEPPPAYRVRLQGGWALELGTGTPAEGVFGQLGQALRRGFARLARRPVDVPALIAAAVGPEDGRRLHHLFRRGTPILLTGGAGGPTPRTRQ